MALKSAQQDGVGAFFAGKRVARLPDEGMCQFRRRPCRGGQGHRFARGNAGGLWIRILDISRQIGAS
ncbi:MAG TPA: hypothetical protein VMV78_00485 [Thiobacillus sp.]|nr:hypothetical protein [Thiobacillus sp.]